MFKGFSETDPSPTKIKFAIRFEHGLGQTTDRAVDAEIGIDTPVRLETHDPAIGTGDNNLTVLLNHNRSDRTSKR